MRSVGALFQPDAPTARSAVGFKKVHALAELAGRMGPDHWMALAIGAVSCALDLQTRRIPNAITLGGAAAGLVYGAVTHGISGLLDAVFGWTAGLAIFLPLFALGGLGAGDVKLLACLGAWLGPSRALWTALYAALAGGMMAMFLALATGYFSTALVNVMRLLNHFRTKGVRPHPDLTLSRSAGPRLPYALPITAGTIAAIWLH